MTGTTAFDVEPEGHPERLIDAMRNGGRRDVETGSLLRTAKEGIGAIGISPPRRVAYERPPKTAAWLAAVGMSLLVALQIALPFAGDARSVGVRDATSFLRSEANLTWGRYLVMTVPVAPDDARADAEAMERSQRDAFQAALSCVGRGTPIGFRPNDVGGPSAGLILALALADRFVGLDHDYRVAGTGAISPTGEVNSVGAVAEKAAAAEEAGADIFLAPADQADEAIGAVGHLPVVGVRSLDEALRVLTGAGCSG